MPNSAFPSPNALHEAGHFVVAAFLNPAAPVAAELAAGSDDGQPYAGTAYYDPASYTRAQLAMISAAGMVAVTIAAMLTGARPTPEQAFALMSPSDWRNCHENPLNPSAVFIDALQPARDLLVLNWPCVIEIARQLDRHGCAYNLVAAEMASRLPDRDPAAYPPAGVTIH